MHEGERRGSRRAPRNNCSDSEMTRHPAPAPTFAGELLGHKPRSVRCMLPSEAITADQQLPMSSYARYAETGDGTMLA
jgi:hypothetical protein